MKPILKNAIDFMANFRPAYWPQLLFLLAALLLFCAPFLPWGPGVSFVGPVADSHDYVRFYTGSDSADFESATKAAHSWYLFLNFPALLLLLAGPLVLFFSVTPPETVQRRRWFLAYLLTLAPLAAIWIRLLVWPPSGSSVLDAGTSNWADALSRIAWLARVLGPGWHATLLGLALLTVGLILLHKGALSLPIGFHSPHSRETRVDLEPRSQLAWFTVLTLALTGFLTLALNHMALLGFLPESREWGLGVGFVLGLLAAGIPAFCGWGLLESQPKDEILGLVRLRVGWLPYALGVALPLLAIAAPQLFVHFRAWLSGDAAWQVLAQLSPAVLTFMVVYYFPPALLEELGWRGYLQSRIVELSGVRQGVLVVALVWGAYHVPADMAGASSLGWALYILFSRMVHSLAHSIPLAWLTLRTRSILPAVVMHCVINVAYHGVRPHLAFWERWVEWAAAAVWFLAGWFLFYRWPPKHCPAVIEGPTPK